MVSPTKNVHYTYIFMSTLPKKKPTLSDRLCAPPGARTLDPNIKSVVLYQLS